jgi:integrase-like protein
MRFGDYCTGWLASREVAGELAPKTGERYGGIIRDHLIPELGGIPLARISASTVRKALGAWRNAPRRDRKKGRLSEKSIHDHFALLKQILGEAMHERLVPDNAGDLCDQVLVPIFRK